MGDGMISNDVGDVEGAFICRPTRPTESEVGCARAIVRVCARARVGSQKWWDEWDGIDLLEDNLNNIKGSMPSHMPSPCRPTGGLRWDGILSLFGGLS